MKTELPLQSFRTACFVFNIEPIMFNIEQIVTVLDNHLANLLDLCSPEENV